MRLPPIKSLNPEEVRRQSRLMANELSESLSIIKEIELDGRKYPGRRAREQAVSYIKLAISELSYPVVPSDPANPLVRGSPSSRKTFTP